MSELVAILNLTPDSFSDGATFNEPQAAIKRITELKKKGAKFIDIGAESTRPGATNISLQEEWQRLIPVLPSLKNFPEISFSLDTKNYETALKAVPFGIAWINDVSSRDEKMINLAKRNGLSYVIMHNLGLPADPKKTLPDNANTVEEILSWGKERIKHAREKGLAKDRIIFDPGIGFGKTKEQSWQIIREAGKFHELGVKLLFGHSRKSFLKQGKNIDLQRLDELTAKVTAELSKAEIHYLRVHNFTINSQAA